MKLRVLNGTAYETRVLRRVFTQVLRDLWKQRPSWAAKWKRFPGTYVVKLGNRRSGLSGHAFLNLRPMWRQGSDAKLQRHHNMFLSLPPAVGVAKLAAVFRHELYHAFGADHGDMSPSIRQCDTEPFEHYPVLLGLEETLKRKTTKPRRKK